MKSISPTCIFDNIIGGCFCSGFNLFTFDFRTLSKYPNYITSQLHSWVLSLPITQKTFGFLLTAPICHQRLLLSLPKIQEFFLCKIHLQTHILQETHTSNDVKSYLSHWTGPFEHLVVNRAEKPMDSDKSLVFFTGIVSAAILYGRPSLMVILYIYVVLENLWNTFSCTTSYYFT